jgi:hypothetical protein
MPDKGPSPYPSMMKIQVNNQGVVKLLRGLRPFKATGPDEIPVYILKNMADHLAPYLTKLYQISLDRGLVPDDWKKANIVPVFKKGEKHMASNYRPVSLTSIACKLLEHIVHSSIMDHFDRHQVLCDEQHGFRVKQSCESQLLITIDDIARNMEEGDQTDIILLDFAKAFDKVPHDRLLHKMEFYGVRQNTLEWIKQFLTNRTQSLILENHKSDPHQITTTRDIEQVQRWAARFAYNCYQDNSPGCYNKPAKQSSMGIPPAKTMETIPCNVLQDPPSADCH